MNIRVPLALHLGAFCDPIIKQIVEQGFSLKENEAEHFQKDADAITRLSVRGLVTMSSVKSARRKLVNIIAEQIGA